MERLNERLELTRKALASFKEALTLSETAIVRDACIQRFEYSTECCWKLAQIYLHHKEGLEIGSPKAAIRACFDVQLLTELQTQALLKLIDARNLTCHTYNEKLAQEIYSNCPQYYEALSQWNEHILRGC